MNLHTPTPLLSHDARLDRLAEVAVPVGLGLRPSQELVMTAPVEALPLARKITERAYKAGASLVTTLFDDEEATLLRFRHAPDEAFDRAAGWLYDGMAAAYRSGAARLAIRGPGTDLLVGLADAHEWNGGAAAAQNGVVCNANIPSEEVFTTPHKDRTEGVVRSTKPLSYGGTLIEDIAVRFENGRIVEATARTGEEVLRKVLDTDEGARKLGEVALVPDGSPISRSGLLFFNTLFDENAASHIALGQAYSKCFRNGTSLSAEELASKGANRSLIHIDWMIGSGEVDVDGIRSDGGAEPLMRRGEWAS